MAKPRILMAENVLLRSRFRRARVKWFFHMCLDIKRDTLDQGEHGFLPSPEDFWPLAHLGIFTHFHIFQFCYSERSDSTGLAKAALVVCMLTVNKAIPIRAMAAIRNVHTSSSIL